MSRSSTAPWRYGIYAFVVGPLLSVVAFASAYLGVLVLESPSVDGELGFVALLGLLLVHLLIAALSYLLAAVVGVSLFMDAQALHEEADWQPNRLLAVALGFVHVTGALLTIPYLISIPGIGFYLYRRRRRISS